MSYYTNYKRDNSNKNKKGFMHRITKDVFSVRGLVKIGLLSAASFVLMLVHFPLAVVLPFVAPWLKLDISDLPALIGAFAMGPLAAVFIEFIKNLLNLLMASDTSGIGELSNFIVGCSFVIPASVIYFRHKTKQSAIIGMVIGIIAMTVMACLSNYYIILPIYMSPEVLENFDIRNYILLSVIPFNLIKSILQSVIAILLYKKISPLLHR